MKVSEQSKRQLRRFLVTGTSSVLLDLTVYALVSTIGTSREFAKAWGYLVGLTLGFVLNKKWTFESRADGRREALSYVVLYAITFFINVVTNSASIVFFQNQVSPRIGVVLAFLLATGITTILNFLGMRFIIFRRGIVEKHHASHVDV